MCTDNDATFTILPTTTQNGVLQLGSHLGHDKGGGPAQRSVARGIRTVAAKFLLVVKGACHMLVHPGEGTLAHVFPFGLTDGLGGCPLAS